MENNQDTQEKTCQIPMEVTEDTIHDFGIDRHDVFPWHVGNRKCYVLMVGGTEEQRKAYMAPEEAEIKRENREGRCMILGKSGKLIRCPDANRCADCEHYAEKMRAENMPASLSVLVENGIEPSVGSHEDDVINRILRDEIVVKLNAIKPIYGTIFTGLYNGFTRQQIAAALGMKPRTLCDNIKKIRSIVKPWVADIFGRRD